MVDYEWNALPMCCVKKAWEDSVRKTSLEQFRVCLIGCSPQLFTLAIYYTFIWPLVVGTKVGGAKLYFQNWNELGR